MHNSDVGGRYFPDGMIDHSVSLRPRDATGGQDLVILVHTQWFPTQVLHGQRLTEARAKAQHLSCTPVTVVMATASIFFCFFIWSTYLSIIFLKSKTPAISLAANLNKRCFVIFKDSILRFQCSLSNSTSLQI